MVRGDAWPRREQSRSVPLTARLRAFSRGAGRARLAHPAVERLVALDERIEAELADRPLPRLSSKAPPKSGVGEHGDGPESRSTADRGDCTGRPDHAVFDDSGPGPVELATTALPIARPSSHASGRASTVRGDRRTRPLAPACRTAAHAQDRSLKTTRSATAGGRCVSDTR